MTTLLIWLALQDDVIHKLRATEIDAIEFNEATLDEFIAAVKPFAGRGWCVSPGVDKAAVAPVTLRMKGVRLISIVKIVLRERGLGLTVKDGVLVIVPQSQIDGEMTLRHYEVPAHVARLIDFTPNKPPFLVDSDFYVRGAGHVPYRVEYDRWFPDSYDGVERWTSDGLPLTERRDAMSGLREMILTNTGDGNWIGDERASISFVNGKMLVCQNRKTHAEIDLLLGRVAAVR